MTLNKNTMSYLILWCYSLFITVMTIIMFMRMAHLEALMYDNVKQKMTDIQNGAAACVWGVTNINNIPEYISAHNVLGVIDYTFYVDDQFNEYKNISEYYRNHGMYVKFKLKTNTQNDMWDCLTDNVFDPQVGHVYASDIKSFIFPLDGDIGDNLFLTNDLCYSFNQYNFFKTTESINLVESHRQRSLGIVNQSQMKIFNLGSTSDERIKFLKNFRMQRFRCSPIKKYGIAKLNDKNTSESTIMDDRLFHLTKYYHVPTVDTILNRQTP